jgi:hypothetical protein
MFTRSTLLIALLVLSPTIAIAQQASQDFEPEDGLFASYYEDPYAATVARELLGGDRYRQCQMLLIPSFSNEHAVYLVRGEDQTAKVVFREFEKQLWPEMQRAFAKEFPKQPPTTVQETQLIEKLAKKTRRLEAPVTKGIADLLEQACAQVLARVRYAPDTRIGLDGVRYHAAHFQIGFGYRAGTVWSPEKGTIAADFIELAETLAAFARAPAADHSKIENTLTQQGQQLLVRIR